jgi:hypothetical protein
MPGIPASKCAEPLRETCRLGVKLRDAPSVSEVASIVPLKSTTASTLIVPETGTKTITISMEALAIEYVFW